MRKSVNRYSLTAEFFFALGAVYHAIVRARYRASRIGFVFNNSFCRIVLVCTDYYVSYCFLAVGVVGDDYLCGAGAGEGESSLCPIGGVGSVDRACGATLAYGRDEYHEGASVDGNAVKSFEELTDSNGGGGFVFAVCDHFKLIDRVCFNSVENGNAVKCVLFAILNGDMLYTPAVACKELVEGEINYLLIFLKNGLTVNGFFACILVEMSCKNTVVINNMITSLYISLDKKEVSCLSPLVTALDLVKRIDNGKTAELMIVSIGCEGVCNKLAVVVIVPFTEVNGTILCVELIGFGNGISVFIGYHILVSTDHHTRVTVPIILIVTANVVVDVYLRRNVAVGHVDVTCTAEHTHKTAACNVPRAPESGDHIGVINGDIGEGNLCILGIA